MIWRGGSDYAALWTMIRNDYGGRADRGFDFLGYQFTPERLTVAKKTVERFVERAARLYEQEPEGSPERSFRFWEYVKRWFSWVTGGVSTKLSFCNCTRPAELNWPLSYCFVTMHLRCKVIVNLLGQSVARI